MKGSFIRDLFTGQLDLSLLEPFPELGRGRVQQIEPLLSRLRTVPRSPVATDLLAEFDLLARARTWPEIVLARVVQELGSVDSSAAISLIAHVALGQRLVEQFGDERLHSLLTARPAPCFAFGLTEASPGSDVSQIQTYAEPFGGSYRITGTKGWVTNALSATHFIILARTVAPQAGNKPRLAAFVVPAASGVAVRPVKTEVLPGAGVGEVHLDGVIVPEFHMLGPRGKGFRVVMRGLSEARLLLGAAATGACLRAFNDTVQRLNARRAFGRQVGNFPSVQDRVATMLADVLALESLVYGVLALPVGGATDPIDRAVVRLAASRASSRVLDAARELFGAAAFIGTGAASQRWADTRALTLLDGSDLALESFILLEGTRDLRRRQAGASDPFDTLGRLDALGTQALLQVKAKVRRALVREVPGARTNALEKRVLQAGEAVSECLRTHGEDIVERQHLHRRLTGIVTELATWAALAARVQGEVLRHGEVGARRMIEATEVWVQAADARLEQHFAALHSNDDVLRDRVANRVYSDGAYPFDIL